MYLRINNLDYLASFTGKMNDVSWDNRPTKTIHTEAFTINVALELFHDDLEWAIVDKQIVTRQKTDEQGNPMYDEEGNPIMEEVEEETVYDNSDYSVLGDIVLHHDGSLSITMGRQTDLEEAYELLYGGE